jgi:quercetin dioxygenase-like cupin family protein
MPIFNPAERPFKELRPGVQARTFWGDQMLVSLVDFDPNAIVSMHAHPQEQSSYLLQGEIELIMDGQTHLIRAGELFIIPGGVAHEVRVGPAHCQILDTFYPTREDLKY